jgi:hypothetical protein
MRKEAVAMLADARHWRERAERLGPMLRDRDDEIARLRAELKRKEAVEVSKPVPSIVRARRLTRQG